MEKESEFLFNQLSCDSYVEVFCVGVVQDKQFIGYISRHDSTRHDSTRDKVDKGAFQITTYLDESGYCKSHRQNHI